ncbi:MAG: T9SS type A sorting domain-containing protein [Paludibacter sp.]
MTTSLRINLRQRGTGAQIGGIRVGKSWDSVLLGINSAVNNPTSNPINIAANGNSIITNEAGSLKVYDLAGIEVLASLTNGKLETSLQKGLYLVRFISNNGKISSSKVLIN